MLAKRIESVQFLMLNPSQIRRMSAIEIKTPETYDKDGYPMEGGLMDPHLGVINPGLRCKTCGQKMKQCPGHFGSMELIRPIIHPEFGRKLEMLMNATCQSCGKISMKEEKLKELKETRTPGKDMSKIIVAKAKKAKKCPNCNADRGAISLDKPTNFYLDKERIYPTQIREWVEKISVDDLRLFGYNPEIIKPEWFIITALPVPPITIRPSITLESGIKSEDDLTHKLVDIIRINLRLKDNIDAGAPQLIIEDLWDLLQYHVTTYFDNETAGVPPAKHRSGRALRTLVQRLKGKKGRFRHNLTGKRVNFAARSTITPDPYIKISELGVPKEIADELTVPEAVTEYNKKEIERMIRHGDEISYIIRPNGTRKKLSEETKEEILEELDIGFRVERKLCDGDVVLFNRQPSLHRLSMMAHFVRVMPGRTFRINPIVCKPYNADFDGDEMNMHVPQTEEGKTEARQLMLVRNQIISPRYGAPVIIMDEDGVSGAFALTLKSTTFSREEAMKYFYEIGLTEMPKPDAGKRYSGKLIFSLMLPQDLNLEFKSNMCKLLEEADLVKEGTTEEYDKFDAYVRIKNGKLISGVIDEAALGEGKGLLTDAFARNYSGEVLEEFYYRISRVIGDLLTRKGMTVGLDEYEVSDSIKRAKDKAVQEELDKGKELVDRFNKGTLHIIPGRTLEESFEISMMRLGSEVKAKVEKEILKEKLQQDILTENPKFNTTAMIISGSRGSSTNLMNIAGFWGQASVREGRPKKGFEKRLITHNRKTDVGALAGGFIRHNFLEGMQPKEYFYHAMGGRQGEVDTGVSTKVSGYLYRRLANSLKDLTVGNDATVRTANKNVVQFVYGEDGVFPQKTRRGKNIEVEDELGTL